MRTGNRVVYLLLLFLLGYNIFCKNTCQLENKDLHTEMTMENVSDSIYFSDIWSLSSIGDQLFFIDQKLSRIFALSDDFSSCKLWGEAGHAGNKFVFLTGIHSLKDTIYVFNGSGQVVFIYDTNGNLLSQYSFKVDELFFSREYRCLIKNKKLIGDVYTVKKGCMTIDMTNHNVTKWGKIFDFESKKQEMLCNGRHLFLLDNIYIAVSDNFPIIELYDQKYDFISEYNYANIDFVDSR